MPAIVSNKSILWILWIAVSLILGISLLQRLYSGENREIFSPGEMTSGHHQIGIACNACHGDSFEGSAAMQDKCLSCHADSRKKPFDSHPAAKFKDPRNADLLKTINALQCITCHSEHRPTATVANGVTQPADFCVHCHADVAEERPSHEGMRFDSCNNAGCHNFHDNRSLYTDYLIKHLDELALLEEPRVAQKQLLEMLMQSAEYPHDSWPLEELTSADADMPKINDQTTQHVATWAGSAHATGGANCGSCHLVSNAVEQVAEWQDHPGDANCATCHITESKHFQQGKHGMRLAADLSPLQVDMAQLPMKQTSAHEQLSCNSCHRAHDYDTQYAAAQACLECHDDQHSLAWESSPHYQTWQREISGQTEPGSGVSCATCHMPRVEMDVSDWLSRVVVQHNQNASLRPNEKMLRAACVQCHGLEYSMSALLDKEQIDSNFKFKATGKSESMDLARKELMRRQKKSAGDS